MQRVRQWPDPLLLPGGKVEAGETILQGAQREFEEVRPFIVAVFTAVADVVLSLSASGGRHCGGRPAAVRATAV